MLLLLLLVVVVVVVVVVTQSFVTFCDFYMPLFHGLER